MAFPIALAAVGAGVLALFALSNKAAAPPGGDATPSKTPGAQPMPADVKAKFDDLMANGVNADGLEQVAGEFDTFGFTTEAASLRARAAQLRANAPKAAPPPFVPPPQAPQPPPFAPPPQAPQPPFVPGVLPEQPPPFVPGVLPDFPSIPIPIPVTPPPPPAAAVVQLARVTTRDPAPAGDLIMRDAPSESGTQVEGGGAEKDGVVTVINPNASADGVWAEILWPGGARRPAAQGFAKKAFLVNLPPSPTTSGLVVGAVGTRYAKCVAPSGCRLRYAPNTLSPARALVESGATVQVLNHAQGSKAEFGSPGPGGWAQVQYKALVGWLPSEWLTAA